MDIQCVLFDLDGTLLDTAPDLVGALNRLRTEENLETLPYLSLRNVASHGTNALLHAAFDIRPGAPDFDRLRARYLGFYREGLALHTALYPGVPETLEGLAKRGVHWGIVTNKPGWLAVPLIEAMGLSTEAIVIVSGDTLPVRKPDPAPLRYACEQAGLDPHTCCYVGDAERDIAAGRRAGMYTLVARYGYIERYEQPERWFADGLLDQPLDLLPWLDTRT
ncbi:HAD-IA family hydrolase [Plasticicumulans acidivorans]|uniref:Phosphoglycolate phosphatase n=1 Tax=Plasticicumulans acidivorans TaxID=886464 RepID=A0A317MT41_9GAMM|nr:HAD-IA family hydrolase [Plasticicumulans acidivorans]PWV59478.1 phosphoglycolate phosphatase [Plasticicumulans acidivorans]